MLARAAREALLLSLQLALAVLRLSGTRSSGDILTKDAAALTSLPVPGVGGQAWWGCGDGAGSVHYSRALVEALQDPNLGGLGMVVLAPQGRLHLPPGLLVGLFCG